MFARHFAFLPGLALTTYPLANRQNQTRPPYWFWMFESLVDWSFVRNQLHWWRAADDGEQLMMGSSCSSETPSSNHTTSPYKHYWQWHLPRLNTDSINCWLYHAQYRHYWQRPLPRLNTDNIDRDLYHVSIRTILTETFTTSQYGQYWQRPLPRLNTDNVDRDLYHVSIWTILTVSPTISQYEQYWRFHTAQLEFYRRIHIVAIYKQPTIRTLYIAHIIT